ncbi:MAG TPA: twin-arginine translocase subunit TatC [Gemmatimonadaceae bacterium]|nr:twin-arginine translocase subunit TatC [Gemmatimonadaceae bacterium]
MPILDHLEELRHRLFWSLGAVALATALSLAVVFTFPVIRFLELPIRPYLPAHKLAFTHPTDPFDITMHTSVAFGIVLSLPVVLHQAWGFVRPAMTRQEERVIRWAAGGSLLLFVAGIALAWVLVLPMAVQWLMGLQTDALTPVITAREYFAFAVDMALAFGLGFQLPVVIVGLVWLDVITPERLARYRRVALFASVVVGALLTPGDLVWTTIAMAAPLYALYEVGIIAGRRIVPRGRH